MKALKHISLALILASLTLPCSLHAFGVPKVPGLTSEVSADSLKNDSASGLDFFQKGLAYYEQALGVAHKAAELSATLDQSQQNQGDEAIKTRSQALSAAADKLIAEGKALNEEQKKLIQQGRSEVKKGMAKWALVATGIAVAAKNGAKDEALVAAVVASTELIKDLGAIKEMQGVVDKLDKLKAKS